MRLIHSFTCIAGSLALAACSSTPDVPNDRYAGLNDPGLYSDAGSSGTTASPIPPSARARRAGNPYPNSQGVRDSVRADVASQQQAYSQAPQGGYYASPQARGQVQDELDAEYQSRTQAFGNTVRAEPRPIDLGPGPGLTRISPDARYGDQTGLYRSPGEINSGRDYRDYGDSGQGRGYRPEGLPPGAPALPARAQPGDCYVLIEQPGQYRQNYRDSGGADYQWREVLCREDQNGALVRDLQRALDRAGFDPGPIDGIYGPLTRRAVDNYQRAQGLPSGDRLAMATLRNLGVAAR